MWQTSIGTRKLEGAERQVFVATVARMMEFLGDLAWEFHDEVLKQIPLVDRYSTFLSVTHHLTDDSLPPKLLAWNSAVIKDVFEHMEADVEMEVESQILDPRDFYTFHRRLVRAAIQEAFPEARRRLPSIRSIDKKEWFGLIQFLRLRVLADEKHHQYSKVADLPREKVEKALKRWKLDEDYFSAIPPFFQGDVKKALEVFGDALSEENEALFGEYLRKSGKKINLW